MVGSRTWKSAGSGGVTTDDNPVYGPTLKETGRDRQPCAVLRQRTIGWYIRDLDDDSLFHRERILLLIL